MICLEPLRAGNIEKHPKNLPLLYRASELGASVGVLMDIIIHIFNVRQGWPVTRPKRDLAEGLASIIICCDVLAKEMEVRLTAGGTQPLEGESIDLTLLHQGVRLGWVAGRILKGAEHMVILGSALEPQQDAINRAAQSVYGDLNGLIFMCRVIALSEGIDLDEAVVHTFNANSATVAIRLPS